MNAHDILPYVGTVAVMKITTGSVTVTTPSGPVVLTQPGMRYVIADGHDEVAALLKMSNIKDLLSRRIVSLAL
jgi:hypothetical protein